MQMQTAGRRTLVLALTILIAASVVSAAGGGPAGKPGSIDLTRGGRPSEARDFNLGPTGARGWMWAWRHHTTDARQILVTKVDAGSPADGVLEVGDVILGVGGGQFDSDARIAFGKAITTAETPAGAGKLQLIRWRAGRTASVTVKLKVLGAYAATAPYHCAKSAALFEQACEAIAKQGLKRVSIPTDLNALALLASGKAKYRPMLAKYAKDVAVTLKQDLWWWHIGYGHFFLTEYYLATKDPAIKDAIRDISLEIARFQSPVGTWGHEHRLTNGLLHGYGAMNQVGLIVVTPLVLARRAGVEDPIVSGAIERSTTMMRWYVDKGSLPYGDHKPWPDHDDNGKNSIAAILYDLLGDTKAATYFSRMATAAHAERENGHTGNFFNVTWALLGVARSGPNATGAYLAEQAWYYDMARRWDGSFCHTGIPGAKGDSYRNWDCTGAYALGYGLPRKSLFITGKGPANIAPMSKAEATSVINDGRHFDFWSAEASYDGMTDAELLKRLTSWSPAVRVRAARSLGHHKGDYTAQLNKLLDSDSLRAIYGATEAIAYLGDRAASCVPRLKRMLATQDPWLLSLTVTALAAQDDATRKSLSTDLLTLAARPLPTDRRRMAQRAVATVLFGAPRGGPKGLYAESLECEHPALLAKAISAVLSNDDGRTRGLLAGVYANIKTDAQLAPLLPAILEATRASAPSGIMFADDIRTAGLKLLARMRVREGMPMCVDQMEPNRWAQNRRIPQCAAALKVYGGSARSLLPQLRQVRGEVEKKYRRNPNAGGPMLDAIDDTIKAIESDKAPPKLRSAAEIIDAAK